MQPVLPLCLLALCAALTAPQDNAAPRPVDQDEESTLALDVITGRMTVPVSINGSTPQPFIIDTGAERSVISRQLADRLGLAAGPQVTLTTMTGSSRVATVAIATLEVGPVKDERAFNAPALEASHLGAQGLLGIEQLRAHAISIDLDSDRMSVRRSRKSGGRPAPRPADSDEIVVTGKNRFGQLIVTEAEFEGTRVTVILDTGSQISMGNLALQRRLRRIPLRGPVTMTSVTGDRLTVNYHIADRVRLGGVEIHGVPVAFADLPPFAYFGLGKRPALMLGMDALQGFRRVDIDFPDRRVRFILSRGGRSAGS